MEFDLNASETFKGTVPGVWITQVPRDRRSIHDFELSWSEGWCTNAYEYAVLVEQRLALGVELMIDGEDLRPKLAWRSIWIVIRSVAG